MRKMARRGIILVTIIALSGCAALRAQPTVRTDRQCSDTPRNAIVRFLQGIIEFSLEPIRMVVTEGMSALGIFAEGDTAKGERIALQLYSHPEVVGPDSSVGIYSLEPVEFEDLSNGETRVLLKRVDVVTAEPRGSAEDTPLQEVRKTFQRNFVVRFQSGSNCISAIRLLEPGWTQMK